MIVSTRAVRHILAAIAVSSIITGRGFASEESGPPKVLSVTVEHPPHISYVVQLVDSELHYVRTWGEASTQEKRIVKTPTAEDWTTFRACLDKFDIWKWKEYYIPAKQPDTIDTRWSVAIEYSDRKVRAEGTNSFPGPNGTPIDLIGEESQTFIELLLALRGIVGAHAFSASECRQIAKGYFLTAVDDEPDKIYLCGPGEESCTSITTVGWREPFIVTDWGIFNTALGTSETIRPESVLPSDVQMRSPKSAWNLLNETKPIW